MRRELCVMACTFCRDPLFHAWLKELDAESREFGAAPIVPSEEACKAFILQLCGIETRNDLDTNKTAANRFHALVRGPFVTWKAQRRAEGVLP